MKPNLLHRLMEAVKGERRLTNLVVILGIAGMLLIALSELWPNQPSPEGQVSQADAVELCTDYEQRMERRLADLIASVEGAGNVQVMVTLSTGSRTVYATDEETSADGAAQSRHLLLDDGSQPPALVETTQLPQVQGVAVLCDGGGDPAIQARVTDIVKVLTGVGASHITVDRLTPPE